MAKAWQIVFFGACWLTLCSNDVLCNGRQLNSNNNINLVSYANQQQTRQPQYNQQLQQLNFAGSNTQMANANRKQDFSNEANYLSSATTLSHQRGNQPSVYASTIDATNLRSPSQLSPAVQATTGSTGGDLNTAAGHNHAHAHGKYYEYRAVPKKKTWKYGYKRGNHKHTISRHEHGKAGKHPHFKTKVKWHDTKSKGKGIHLWDYNHHDKKHYHHG